MAEHYGPAEGIRLARHRPTSTGPETKYDFLFLAMDQVDLAQWQEYAKIDGKPFSYDDGQFSANGAEILVRPWTIQPSFADYFLRGPDELFSIADIDPRAGNGLGRLLSNIAGSRGIGMRVERADQDRYTLGGVEQLAQQEGIAYLAARHGAKTHHNADIRTFNQTRASEPINLRFDYAA